MQSCWRRSILHPSGRHAAAASAAAASVVNPLRVAISAAPSTTKRFRRSFSSATSDDSIVRGPSQPSKTWERGARSVKNTDVTNPYLEAIRDVHDPSQHIKTIEDELKETIGKALGKQGEKILNAVKLMEKELKQYEELLEKHQNNYNHPDVIGSAESFNRYRAQAIQARWELIVHRNAVGFVVQNHSYVMEQYPIRGALPVGEVDNKSIANEKGKEESKNGLSGNQLSGQLDWWQRIGRWK